MRQLFDVVSAAHPVVAEDITVVPEFVDDGRGAHAVRCRALFSKGQRGDGSANGGRWCSCPLIFQS